MSMGQHDGYRIAIHPSHRFFQGTQILLHHTLIRAQTFLLTFVGSFGSGEDMVWMQIGQTTHQRLLPSSPLGNGNNEIRRVFTHIRHHMHLEQITHGFQGTQPGSVVMIAGNDDGYDVFAGELRQCARHQFLRSKRRTPLVKNVSSDENRIDPFAPGNLNNLVKHSPVLVHTRTIADSPAHMPI